MAICSRSGRLRAALALLVGLAACDGPSPPEGLWTGTIDTLDGGGVRVSSPATPVWAPGEGPLLVERLRVGSGVTADGAEGPLFGAVPDIAPTGEGGVWILDGDAREVVRVDAGGREVARIGGPGDAPDRFQYPRRLQLRGDTLWVEDLGAARWSAWSVDGAFLGSWPLPEGVAGGNASWTASGLVGVEGRRDDDDVVRWAGRWVATAGGFVRVDSLAPPPVPPPVALHATFTRQGRPVRVAFPVPLAHQPGAIPDPDGSGWIVTPGGGEYRILRVADDGRVRREITRDFTPVPVPEAEREAAVERLPAELRDAEADRVPSTRPPFDRVVPATDGGLWVVRRGDQGGTVFDLFDPDGRYRGPVGAELDLAGFWLHVAGPDGAWGVQRDDRGRPVVRHLVLEGG